MTDLTQQPALVAARRDPRLPRGVPRRRAATCRWSTGSPASTTTARCGASDRRTCSSTSSSTCSSRPSRATPRSRRSAEFAALLSGDRAAIAELGLPRIAMALSGLCAGISPEEFTDRVREFMGRATPPDARPAEPDRRLPADAGAARGPALPRLHDLRGHRWRHRVRPGGQRRPVRRTAGARGRDAARVRRRRPRRQPVAGAFDPAVRRGERGCGQGGQHPDPARAAAHPGRRQLRWRPADAGVGGRRATGRRSRCWSTTTTPTASSAIAARRRASSRPSRSPTSARRLGWTTISMADDWETVFPPLG